MYVSTIIGLQMHSAIFQLSNSHSLISRPNLGPNDMDLLSLYALYRVYVAKIFPKSCVQIIQPTWKYGKFIKKGSLIQWEVGKVCVGTHAIWSAMLTVLILTLMMYSRGDIQSCMRCKRPWDAVTVFCSLAV